MKKTLFIIAASLSMLLLFSSCKKDEGGWNFDYSQETLCSGTWVSVASYSKESGTWIDLTSSYMKSLQFSVKFRTDYTYYATGFFGTGNGTYEASGSVITTYLEGEKFLTCDVKKLEGDVAEVNMSDVSGDSMLFRLQRK